MTNKMIPRKAILEAKAILLICLVTLFILSVVQPAIAALKRPKGLTERNWPSANPVLCFLSSAENFENRARRQA
jgi:hypothetical protein